MIIFLMYIEFDDANFRQERDIIITGIRIELYKINCRNPWSSMGEIRVFESFRLCFGVYSKRGPLQNLMLDPPRCLRISILENQVYVVLLGSTTFSA